MGKIITARFDYAAQPKPRSLRARLAWWLGLSPCTPRWQERLPDSWQADPKTVLHHPQALGWPVVMVRRGAGQNP